MRLLLVVGARPNFIKAGPLMPAFAEADIQADIVHTGQHYDSVMSDVFFADLELPEPRWFLGVGSGTHAVQTGIAMMKLEELLAAERPDLLLVVGDVNSTLAGALAAAKLHIPVVHLEAGLRSGDMSMPEEVNRLVTDQLSSLLLTPVVGADMNLASEGISPERIRFVGNVMAESVLRNLDKVTDRDVCSTYGMKRDGFVLATIHRPENTDHPERLAQICEALRSSPLPVLFPAHPRTRPLLAEYGVDACTPGVTLTEPVRYLDMLGLQCDAAAIITDSGGIQEEACMVHTPCVTVRRNTERQITVELGSNQLVSADTQHIGDALRKALDGERDWLVPERWDKQVSNRVVEALLEGVTPLPGY